LELLKRSLGVERIILGTQDDSQRSSDGSGVSGGVVCCSGFGYGSEGELALVSGFFEECKQLGFVSGTVHEVRVVLAGYGILSASLYMGFIEGGFSCVALVGYGGGAIFNGYRSCGSGKLSILGRSGEKVLVDGGEISQSYGVSGLSGVALVGYEGDTCQQCQDGENDDEFYQGEGTGSSQASGEHRE
jgi:hypothetical protein